MSPTRGDPLKRAPVVERFRASGFEPQGYTLSSYAAVQVSAQAADKARSLDPSDDRSPAQHQFDTVLGTINFDDKGDLAVHCMYAAGTSFTGRPSVTLAV
jgi:branched-chain amino acid transport system substrate-binding protein